MRRSLLALGTIGASFLLISCASDEQAVVLRVSAASSLTGAFEAIEAEFESENPGVDVQYNLASSSDLARQIIEGSTVDVFASADTRNMDKVSTAGFVDGGSDVFATNSLAIIVASGNPLGISGLADLADESIVFVTCDPAVPIGKYSQEVLTKAGAEVEADSLEENVKSIVAKVTSGEADAGIVYVTDVLAAGDAATGVMIPDEVNVVAEYPIAPIAGSKNPDLARRFIEFLTSDAGTRILQRFGFGTGR